MFVPPDDWRAGGDHFEWRGHRIFCRVGGAADHPALVLIHGFPTASWDWSPVWDALARHHRVLTLDMIGFGFSAKPARFAYSTDAQADLFEALLAREGVTRYRVLAHDYGVTVAQELLARQREGAGARIEAVGFLNGGLFPETHRALPAQRLLASRLGPLVARASTYRGFAGSMKRVWGSHRVGDAELGAMWRLASQDDGLARMPALLGYIAERVRYRARWVGAIVDPGVPVRLIIGLDDPVSGAHMVARYRELVRDPDVVELPGVGHYPQVEAPAAVLAAAVPFFAS